MMTIAYILQSSLVLLEKVHEKMHPTLLIFHTLILKLHTFFPPIVLLLSALKKLFLACFQLQTGSQELVCLLRGSDIFALQEVQLTASSDPPDA